MQDYTETTDGRKPLTDSALAEHADTIRALGKQTVANIIEIGRRLTEVKQLVGHGNWLPWLEHEFGWTDKTAENFINVYKLGGKFEKFSDLDLPLSGLYLLAAPSTPDEARNEIIKRAEAGEAVGVSDIKETVEKAKRRHRERHHQRKRGRKASIETTAEPSARALQTIKTQGGDRVLQALALVEEMGPPERRRFLELLKQKYGFSVTGVEEVSRNDREWAAQPVEQKAEHIEPPDDGLDIPDFLRRAP